MSEEEKKAIDILKNSIADYVIAEYCEKCADNKICDDRNEDCYFIQAIDKVVNIIEKQDNKIKFLLDNEKSLKEMNRNQMKIIDKQQKEIEGKNAVIDSFKHTEKVLTEQLDAQQKEIEEKTTIIMAGAEKVKQLEKEIEERDKYNITTLPFEELKEMIEQNKNISIFGKDYISRDKIREKIKEYDKWIKQGEYIESLEAQKYALNELLEEK